MKKEKGSIKNDSEKIEVEPLKVFSHGMVTGAIWLDNRRAKIGNVYPIRYRITFKRDRRYYKTGYDVTYEDWDNLPKARGETLKEIRNLVVSGFDQIESQVKEIKDIFSFELLEKRLGRGKRDLVLSAYESRIEDLNNTGQVGTASIYNSAKVSLSLFNPDLKFNEITPKFLENYENHSINHKDSPITYSTLSMYIRTLRTLFNIAIRDGEVSEVQYPFSRSANDGGYKIKSGSGTKIALTVEQLTKFINYKPSTNSMQRSKDIFLLSFYLGGINLKDLLLLKWKQIENNELVYTRSKTSRTVGIETKIRIPLTKESEAILIKWGTDKKPENRILPFMPIEATPKDVRRITLNVIRQINKHLVIIGNKIDVHNISTYVARHSLATIMKNSGISESFIKEVLGHSSLKTTQSYLKSFETDQRRDQFEKLGSILKDANIKTLRDGNDK